MAIKFTKSGLKSSTQELANYLCAEIQAAQDARDGLKDRWEQNEQVYRNDPEVAAVQLYDNFEPRTTPVLSPRINRIVNVTLASLTSPRPWVQAIPEDGEHKQANEVERGLQSLMERAGFERVFRRALVTTALTGVSVVRIRMTAEGIKLDHIHPNDFVVAPTYGLALKDAHLVGHRFYIPMWQLEDRVKSGLYNLIGKDEDLKAFGGANPDDDPSGRDPAYDRSEATTDTIDGATDEVEVYEVLARLHMDGERGWYRTVIAPSVDRVLLIEEYPYADPWYFDLRFHDEEGKWWPASSAAQNIIGLCLLENDMFNLTVAGSMATAVSPVVISGGSLGKKLKSINLGGLIETPYDVRVQEIPQHFDPGAMPGVMALIDNLVDSQTGVNQLALGQEFLQNQTATAASALIEATKQNEGTYGSFGGMFMEEAWRFVHTLCLAHKATVRKVYGGALRPGFFQALSLPVRWQAMGRSASNAPHILLVKLQEMLNMALTPGSPWHAGRTQEAIGEVIDLPMSTEKLKKTDEERAQEQQAFAAQ